MNEQANDRYETLILVEEHHFYKNTWRIYEKDPIKHIRITTINPEIKAIIREDKTYRK